MHSSTAAIEEGLQGVAHLQLVPLLVPISKSFRALLDLKLQALGLEVGQDHLLLALEPGSGVPIGRLADRLAVRPSTVSKMVDRLERKGVAKRYRNSGDGRVTLLHLTEDGARMQAEVRHLYQVLEAVMDWFAGMTHLVGDEDLPQAVSVGRFG